MLDVAFPGRRNAGALGFQGDAGQGRRPGADGVRCRRPRPWPRDLRGHLRVAGTTFQAFLPGMVCSGALEPALAMDCRTSEEPWVIESGSRTLLLAAFAAARNYFDGRVTSQSGLRKTLAPFYSAASVEAQGRTLWVLAMVDGRTQILDAALEPVATLNATWGSDIAGSGCALRRRSAGTRHAGRRRERRRRHAGVLDRGPRGNATHGAGGIPRPGGRAVVLRRIGGRGDREKSRYRQV